jgi:hypothetical protein
MMNKLLEEAFAQAAKLPEHEQETVAAWLLEELATERRWEQSFAESADALAHMGEEALAEHRGRRTQPLDPERL